MGIYNTPRRLVSANRGVPGVLACALDWWLELDCCLTCQILPVDLQEKRQLEAKKSQSVMTSSHHQGEGCMNCNHGIDITS